MATEKCCSFPHYSNQETPLGIFICKMWCLITPSINPCDQGYGMGGCSVLGQDFVGNDALSLELSCGAGAVRAGVPCSLDGWSPAQPQYCKLTHSLNTVLSNQNNLDFSGKKKADTGQGCVCGFFTCLLNYGLVERTPCRKCTQLFFLFNLAVYSKHLFPLSTFDLSFSL